ncbi:MAG: efflux RND transporter periplasmic adaptor subunit [Nannocystaceae bacterium]|nr:efflux RND transporter periplasmic adaptor subunit [Nannocystaceae bacterium]
MRRICIVMLAAALGCNAAAAPESSEQAEKPAPPPAKSTWVEAATIERSSATLELLVPGEVEGSKEAILASSQGGFVEAANVEIGDIVQAGDPLFRIDTTLYSARLEQVRAELRASQREHKRAEKLGKILSGADRDNAKDRYDLARAGLKVAQIQVKRATVRAPFDGVIAEVELEKGEVASLGAPIARLLQLDPVKVTVSVPDRDVVGLSVGTKVTIATDALAEPRIGTLSRIHPAADMDTRAFTVEIEVPNEDRALLPGMIARVRIEQSIAEDKLLIPQNLLVTARSANGVFVVEDDVARWRPLKLGAMVREQVIILEGLEVGENVIVVGQRTLADGDAVIISRQGRCCATGRPEFDS